MKTDVVVISSEGANMEAALAEVDKVGAYKDLTSRETLTLRLLAEETMAMMRRFREYRPSWVRMPARMAGMPQKVWKKPVAKPASIPATTASSSASQGFRPRLMQMAATAPPVAREPSTVRSAMSSTR